MITLLVGIIGGIAFPIYLYGTNIQTIAAGMIVGILISFSITTVEKRILHEPLRRIRFTSALLLRTAVQLVVILFYVLVGFAVYKEIFGNSGMSNERHLPTFREFMFGGELLTIVLYGLTLSFFFNMIRQMSRMLGQNVLLNMIIGKYSKPIEEERIFMFLDLNASTTIAERIGNIRYHELLDDYVYDITKPILESGGEIYQYVGDEVVVTWSHTRSMKAMNCIDCFFRISEVMEQLAPKYQQKYGFIPGFKAGFHYGTVVTGQIGDIKKEIVFQGDVVNTASRIKETCNSLGAKILLSRELLDVLPIANSSYKALRVGSFLLKGKEHEVELFSVVNTEAAEAKKKS
ncbi:MAG: adenylate/guanylate cyclase domain-containing protein [Bacteroidota bacterium]|nr:adenylate/guanylate cyclase domain-containing protein [Bacteroidota bacterium]MDP4235643.1 adenylate/guanylate cyclase domain-containing protein [Bacteroidota bacterium]